MVIVLLIMTSQILLWEWGGGGMGKVCMASKYYLADY
jgi:hypothetical protein